MWPARRFSPSGPVQSGRLCIAMGCLPLLLLSACDKPLVVDATLPQQFAVNGCIGECRIAKQRCEDDARYGYRQCQAGYAASFRNYRWCLASGRDTKDCGYSWWSCAENLYGYCFNRFTECTQVCESRYGYRPAASTPPR